MKTPSWLKPRPNASRPAPWNPRSDPQSSASRRPFAGPHDGEAAPPAPIEEERPSAIPHEGPRSRSEAAAPTLTAAVPPRPDLAQVVHQIESAHMSALSHLHDDMVALAMMVARHVIGDELRNNPDALLRAARAALADVVGTHSVVLRAHPDDVGALAAAGLVHRDGARPVEIRADVELAPGDVVVEAECGKVDARVQTRFAAAERALQHALHGAVP